MLTYIDSAIFLYAVLYDDERAARCRNVLSDIVDGKLEAVNTHSLWLGRESPVAYSPFSVSTCRESFESRFFD